MNSNDYVEEILKRAKKDFKISISKNEFFKLLEIKDKYLESNSIEITNSLTEEFLENKTI